MSQGRAAGEAEAGGAPTPSIGVVLAGRGLWRWSPSAMVKIEQARMHDVQSHQVTDKKFPDIRMSAWPRTVGINWGAGVGFYFLLLLLLPCGFLFFVFISAVPFWYWTSNSPFADALDSPTANYTAAPFSLGFNSLSFAGIPNDANLLLNTTAPLTLSAAVFHSSWLTWGSDRALLIRYAVLTAVSFALFVCFMVMGMRLWAHYFMSKEHQAGTVEVGDFTILLRGRGLPGLANALEVRNFCANIQAIQTGFGGPQHEVLYVAVVKRTQSGATAAFVTFNSRQAAQAFLAKASRTTRQALKKAKIWATAARAPDDYIFDNFFYSPSQLNWLRAIFRCMLVLVFFVTAIALTQLCSRGNQTTASQFEWQFSTLGDQIQAAEYSYAALGSNRTTPPNAYPPLLPGCQSSLPGNCSALLSRLATSSRRSHIEVSLAWGSTMVTRPEMSLEDQSALLQLLQPYVDRAVENLQHPNGTGDPSTPLGGCLPCYCLGLTGFGMSNQSVAGGADWRETASQQCAAYIKTSRVFGWTVKIGVALIMWFVNQLLQLLVGKVVVWERHASTSSEELANTYMSFGYMFVNSAVVLLVVNAQFMQSLARGKTWLGLFFRNGQYSDFTSLWYENVGVSIVVVLMFNAATPVLMLMFTLAWGGVRTSWLHCKEHWQPQDQASYDSAFQRPVFVLQPRLSAILLNVTLALMFGTGMPLCYVIVVVACLLQYVVDIYALVHVCSTSVRYGKELPTVVVGWLPWGAMLHCTFGLWQHTYFLADDNQQENNGISATMQSVHSVWRRITQDNGLPLLVCLGAVMLLTVASFIVQHVIKSGWCDNASQSCEVWTYRDALNKLIDNQLEGDRDSTPSNSPHHLIGRINYLPPEAVGAERSRIPHKHAMWAQAVNASDAYFADNILPRVNHEVFLVLTHVHVSSITPVPGSPTTSGPSVASPGSQAARPLLYRFSPPGSAGRPIDVEQAARR